MKVFVYGSLMKKYWNHYLLVKQRYLGRGLLKNYEMYHVSSFPGIISKPGENIIGEVYDIDEITLKRLDQLESEGLMYLRVEEDVIINDRTVKAFVYVWNRSVSGYSKVKEMPWRPE